jgi:hypothetical protein
MWMKCKHCGKEIVAKETEIEYSIWVHKKTLRYCCHANDPNNYDVAEPNKVKGDINV